MDRLTELYKRFLDGSLSEEELAEFWALVHSNRNNNSFRQQVYNAYDQDDNASELKEDRAASVLKKILDSPRKPAQTTKHRPLRTWVTAAACLVLIVVGSYFYKVYDKHKRRLTNGIAVNTTQYHAVLQGSAMLEIQNGIAVNIDTLQRSAAYKQLNLQLCHTKRGTDSLVYSPSNNPPALINSIKTDNARNLITRLPDGTMVWLNAKSSLKFAVNLSKTYREVFLTGEAYFEVAKRKDSEGKRIPFVVHLLRNDNTVGNIEVLGTHFNVKDYADEKNITCTLFEGSIKYKDRKHSVLLKPGQQLTVENKLVLDTVQNIQNSIAWKDGQILLDRESVQEIMNEIGRWYGVRVQYEGNPPHASLSGILDRSLPLQDILQVLNSYGVNCHQHDDTIIVSQ